MWRTATTLVVALALGALLVVATAAGRGEKPASQAVIASPGSPAPAATADPSEAAMQSVPSASGAVLAEMTRRLGTPRRVSLAARRRERMLRRIEARIRAQQEAAQARADAAAARARARAAAALANRPDWYDAGAESANRSGPMSPDEAAWLHSGRGGWIEPNGYARAPDNAPDAIKRVIQAGNLIARSPYLWGGGHGQWQDKGYDCSGSVSFALAAGGLLGYAQTSGQLMNWGAPGPGRWLTIYAHEGHVFMYVAGLRFDTSGRAGDHASRWQLAPRPADGFAVRHYPGL